MPQARDAMRVIAHARRRDAIPAPPLVPFQFARSPMRVIDMPFLRRTRRCAHASAKDAFTAAIATRRHAGAAPRFIHAPAHAVLCCRHGAARTNRRNMPSARSRGELKVRGVRARRGA